MNIFISESVKEAIALAAAVIQQHYEQEEGTHYTLEDLKKVLVNWLEDSIEGLANDAMFHCIEGDRSCAFNRSAFVSALKKVPSAHTPQEADKLTVS